MDFQAIRKEYENEGIHERMLPDEPLELFREWFALAIEHCPGRWLEPNAMSLATASPSGDVTNRYVLMKDIASDGIHFFTNYDSVKGRQLKANPKAAATFHWPYLGRQVRLEGIVEKTSREMSEDYFHSRTRGSQLSAAVSSQSQEVASREELEVLRTRLVDQHDGQPIPLPENWGGYLLKPNRIEFWQGRLDRLHDRILYQFENQWQRSRLFP